MDLGMARARFRSQGLSPAEVSQKVRGPGRREGLAVSAAPIDARQPREPRRGEELHLADLQEKAANRDAHGILELALTGEFAGAGGGGVVFRRGIGGAAAHGGGDRPCHAGPVSQHRQAVRRNVAIPRPPAGGAGPWRCAQPVARARGAPRARCRRYAVVARRRCLLRFSQSGAAGSSLETVRRTDHRAQALPDPRARHDAAGGMVRRPLPFQSALAMEARANLDAYAVAHKLPPHPLVADGYPSIGCMPCTRRVAAGEDYRAGRWAGLDKDECGIHAGTDGDGI